MMTTSNEAPALDLKAIKAKQQMTWASGDFAVVGTTLQIVGETLCEAVDLRSGSKVLDVACGNGNASLAAARRFCKVTGIDYVPALLAKARERADAERLPLVCVEGDAEALPFDDGAFDCVLSTFGVMFAPDQKKTAAELLRVCRSGGTIGLASWTPEGMIGELLGVVGKHVPPPRGLTPTTRWGVEAHIANLFEGGLASLKCTRREFSFRYESPAHFVDVFRRFYGPTHKAFGALDDAGKNALEADLLALIAKHDRGRGRGCVVPAEYLEVVAVRR